METEFPRLLNDENVEAWEDLNDGYLNYLEEVLVSQETDVPELTEALEGVVLPAYFPNISFEGRVGPILQEAADCRATENKVSTIQLAWAEYKDRTWTAEKVGEGSLTVSYRAKESFLLKPEIKQSGLRPPVLSKDLAIPTVVMLPTNELVITVYSAAGLHKSAHGSFRFTGCNGRVVVTAHEDLSMLDPVALIQLRQTGQCFVSLPEALFDLDYPGHYLRRIKNVSITIPCIMGPYTGVNCTLTLLKSSIRQRQYTA